jgi:V/A-type H+-transporting ATPase subunit K
MTVLWIPIAAALVMSIAALATAWAQSRIGAAGAAALAEKPELKTTVVIMIAIPETVAILGFVVATMIMLRGGGP